MSNTFLSADHHFGHRKFIIEKERPFSSVEEMDEALIQRWREQVGPKDIVYYLGDLSFSNKTRTLAILDQLPGHIHYILGNHEKSIKGEVATRFERVTHYYEIRHLVGGEKVKIILSHYPFEVWNMYHYGSWHCHGHSHGSLTQTRDIRRMDVGVDTRSNLDLWPLEEVEEIMKARGIDNVDHHTE